jgi:hypothetical protein
MNVGHSWRKLVTIFRGQIHLLLFLFGFGIFVDCCIVGSFLNWKSDPSGYFKLLLYWCHCTLIIKISVP